MRLSAQFKQREIFEIDGSLRIGIPTRHPSGPQQAETPLLRALLEQLSFSNRVADVVSYPIIGYGNKAIEADAFVRSHPSRTMGGIQQWLIIVERDGGIRPRYALDFDILRAWSRGHHAGFKILTATDIDTPHLANVRLMAEHAGRLPDAVDPDLAILLDLIDGPGANPIPVSLVVEAMTAMDVPESRARRMIKACVSSGLVACDLSKPFDDASILSTVDVDLAHDNKNDPILRAIMEARDG